VVQVEPSLVAVAGANHLGYIIHDFPTGVGREDESLCGLGLEVSA
jgi:hypothetical protein